MIQLIGDIHGDFKTLAALVKAAPHAAEIVQVGDFGFWPQLRDRYKAPERMVYFIDGNHDHCQALAGEPPFDKPAELWPNATYVPRGTVLTLNGKNVLFLGGAKSIDRAWRPRYNPDGGGYNPVNCWFPEEVISDADTERALVRAKAVGKIDLMVTHTPPQWMVDKYFGVPGPEWGLPRDWRDESAGQVELVWKELDCPDLVCGHMHRSVTDGVCRILTINEVMLWNSWL